MKRPVQSHLIFLRILFEPDEYICPCSKTNVKGSPVETRTVQVKDFIFTPGTQWVSANPMKPYTTRRISNVSSFRNFVIEFDKNTKLEQYKLATELGLPYSTCVYSGNKSLHFVISLKEDLDLKRYRKICKRIKEIIPQADEKCLEPSTFTRLPGAIRNGKVQELLEVRKKISLKEMEDWMAQFPVKKVKQSIETYKQVNGELKDITKRFLKWGIKKSKNISRHDKLKKMAIDFRLSGFSAEEATSKLVPAYLKHNPDKTEEEVIRMVNWVYDNLDVKNENLEKKNG